MLNIIHLTPDIKLQYVMILTFLVCHAW